MQQEITPHATEYYIGLMSGTSIDSLDGVLVALTPKDHAGQVQLKTLATTTLDWSAQAKALLNSLCTPGSAQNNVQGLALGRQLVAAQAALVVQQLLDKAKLQPSAITAIGSHGQTIWHEPKQDSSLVAQLKDYLPPAAAALPLGFSLQIDNGPLIANSTDIDTVFDFRSADLAHGGQGAPLTQAFHQMIFGAEGTVRMVLNLGGIANLTVLDQQAQLVTAYDTGPANTLIDLYCRKALGWLYDKDGAGARRGHVDQGLLTQLLDNEYFTRPVPKSTGRELFNADYLKQQIALTLPDTPEAPTPEHYDLLATLTELTATTISHELVAQAQALSAPSADLIVCGGGAYNGYLLERIAQLSAAHRLHLNLLRADELGIDAKFIEAQAFAYFAYCTVHALPLNLGRSTGAQAPSILGCLSPAPHGHYQRKIAAR